MNGAWLYSVAKRATSDPGYSQLTRMFIAVASYRLNNNNVVTTQSQVNSVVARLRPIFSQQGSILPGGDPEWNDFLEDDMNAYPMTLTYESLYVGLEEAHDPRIQQIAEDKFGFITTNPDNYQKAMAKAGIKVAGGLPVVNPPAYGILQQIGDGLP